MKFGCASFFLPDPTYTEKLRRAFRLGYEGIEVRLEENPDLDRQVAEIETAFENNPVRPCNVIVRSPAYRATLDSHEAKSAKLASARNAIRIASRLGTSTVVQPEYHPQIPLPAFEALCDPTPVEEELLFRFLSEVAEYAEKHATTVLLEPLNRYESHYYHRLEEAAALCASVGSAHLKLCADFYHMNMEEHDIAASLENAYGFLHYIQLGDSNRKLPGKGHIDFSAAFSALQHIGYDGFLTLECQKPINADKELEECLRYLRGCLESNKEI